MVSRNKSSQSTAIPAVLFVLGQVLFPAPAFSADLSAEEIAGNPLPQEIIPETESSQTESPDLDSVESLTPEEQEKIQQAVLKREQYIQIIDQLELEAGADVYGAELLETYRDLGFTYYTLKQYEEAVAAFDKALQLVRIGNGLNSVQQLPVLQEILISNEDMNNWEAVDVNSHLIFHINRKNFPVGDERRIQALNELGKWTLKAVSGELIENIQSNSGDLIELYKNEIRQVEELDDYDGKNFQLASLYLGEARAKMSITKVIIEKPLTDYMTGQPQSTTSTRCYLVRLPNGKATQVCETIEVPNLDYYIDPSQMQYQQINRNLNDIRRAISDAFEIVQTEEGYPEKQNALLMEIQQITESYNTFVTENAL
jgi:tetratricopeptide (TPR) repeat protein